MDYTQMVADYLNELALGFAAYLQVPSDRDSALPFAVVELTGAQGDFVRANVSVDVDCWAESRHGAEEMASSVRRAAWSMPDAIQNVFGADASALYSNRDPDSGTPRYTVSVDIYCNE